jgi:cell division septation protein DedD
MKQVDFIQYIAQELSISEEESQELLREFSVHLNNELNETAAAQLAGLGALKKDASGISFELDPSFAIGINYKYAGMQPIVVSEDFNVGIEEDEELEVVEEVESQANEEFENEPVLIHEPESEEESEFEEKPEFDNEPEEGQELVVDEEADSEEDREADENTEAEVGPESEEETEPDEEDELVHEPESGLEEESEPELEKEQETEPDLDDETKARIAKRTASLRSPKKTKRSNLTPIYIGIGVVFIAAVIAGWQFYLKPILDEPAILVGDSGTEQSNVTEAMDSNSISEEQQPSVALDNEKNGLAGEASSTMVMNDENSIISPENSASKTNTDSVVSAPIMAKNVAEIPVDQPRYGLMGEVDSRANDGYTLVLFSLSNRQSAMEKYEQYRSAGYRSLLSPVNSSRFGLMWRVSIGQFGTVEQAIEVAKELPKEIIEDYFITKI